MRHRGTTPPFRNARGQVLPGSIAEVGYYRFGGVDQWVLMRGTSVTNPPLILLHGGPGFPEMSLYRHFNSQLERSFTVVYWDQRGTNKSFSSKIPRSSMTVEQFLSDLDELVHVVFSRLKKEKVALYGHSWGSALGALYSARHPEKVCAYVGAAQIGDWPASETRAYNFLLSEAVLRNNKQALKELRAIGRPPFNAKTKMVEAQWQGRLLGLVRGLSLWMLLGILIGGPEASFLDLPNALRGLRFSHSTMWDEVSSIDLTTVIPTLKMPVFFFLGREDHVVDAETSAAYFDVLIAPSKKLVWFEESAHEPPFEEPEKFNASLTEMVRPLSVG